MNVVAYLLEKTTAPETYICQLIQQVPYRLVFNYFTDEYVKDFYTEKLWENFFFGAGELYRSIQSYSIRSLEELMVRASEYFEHLTL